MSAPDSKISVPGPGELGRPCSGWPVWLKEGLLLAFLGLVAGIFQWGAGAYRQEFGGHPDEAAHFVTALMIHDYLASAAGSHPMRFAERYYEHYPKVALGHWPPVFYLVQAGWMLVWGVSRAVVLGLLALVGALTARLLAGTVARRCGWVGGLGAALLWLSLPLVQIHTGMVMADLPVTLLMLLAVVALGRFLDDGRSRDALAFGVWAGLAILTKGSAMSLALVVPWALVLSGRYAVLRRPALWASAALVAVLAGPWTAYFQSVNKEGWADTPWRQFVQQAVPYYLRVLAQEVGGLGIGLAMAGAGFWWLQRRHGDRLDGVSVSVLAMLPAILLFQALTPVGIEQRYLIPALPGLLVLIFLGIWGLAKKFRRLTWAPAGMATFLVWHGLTVFRLAGEPNSGFLSAARSLAALQEPAGTPVLVSSDASGEGQFIAALAILETRPGHRIHRSSKLLAQSAWTGKDYRPLAGDERELAGVLDRARIRSLAVDLAGESAALPPHRQLVGRLVRSLEPRLECAYRGPWRRRDREVPDQVRLYRLKDGDSWTSLVAAP